MIQIAVPKSTRYPLMEKRTFNGRFGCVGRWLYEKLSNPDTETYHYFVTLNEDRVLEAICKQSRAIEMVYGGECEEVIVGINQIHELCELELLGKPILFSVQGRLEGPEGLRVRGMKIRYIPWFDGILCVPKENWK